MKSPRDSQESIDSECPRCLDVLLRTGILRRFYLKDDMFELVISIDLRLKDSPESPRIN